MKEIQTHFGMTVVRHKENGHWYVIVGYDAEMETYLTYPVLQLTSMQFEDFEYVTRDEVGKSEEG